MTTRTLPLSLTLALGLAPAARVSAEAQPLPLPPAPLRLVIPDPGAFDAALTGSYRHALEGTLPEADPLMRAWRTTRVGAKLEDQWGRLAKDLPWTWGTIRKLQPRALGLAILDVGHLEALLAIRTPLAALPLPPGKATSHAGVVCHLVARGAGDRSNNPSRRMGLAWARMGDLLLVATSEGALRLAVDTAQKGGGARPFLEGLLSMELDLDRLRQDRYFRREFLFPQGPETGKVRAALRREAGNLVEVREGTGEPRGGVFRFHAAGAAASGWEPQGTPFWPTFRRGLLEPVLALADKPVPRVAPLPPAAPDGVQDAYLVDFTRSAPQREPWEEGDLIPWQALLARNPVPSWGWWVDPDGARRLVFPWPASLDGDFLERCRATVARRAGRATVARVGEAQEIRVGPQLPALALRRQGAFLWVAPSARHLKELPLPQSDAGLVRWARVDLGAVRGEAWRWAKAEGPARPEQVRPLSDRLLGLLGWIPATRSLAVERHRIPTGWTERVTFGGP
jgi:hypothetical protein